MANAYLDCAIYLFYMFFQFYYFQSIFFYAYNSTVILLVMNSHANIKVLQRNDAIIFLTQLLNGAKMESLLFSRTGPENS